MCSLAGAIDEPVVHPPRQSCDNKGATLTVYETNNGYKFGFVAEWSYFSPLPGRISETIYGTASKNAFMFCLNCAGEWHGCSVGVLGFMWPRRAALPLPPCC